MAAGCVVCFLWGTLVLFGGCASTPPVPNSSQTLTLPPVGAWQWTVIEPVAAAESFDQIAIGPDGTRRDESALEDLDVVRRCNVGLP